MITNMILSEPVCAGHALWCGRGESNPHARRHQILSARSTHAGDDHLRRSVTQPAIEMPNRPRRTPSIGQRVGHHVLSGLPTGTPPRLPLRLPGLDRRPRPARRWSTPSCVADHRHTPAGPTPACRNGSRRRNTTLHRRCNSARFTAPARLLTTMAAAAARSMSRPPHDQRRSRSVAAVLR